MNKIAHPDAQFPLAEPPLEEHSLAVKQVPFRNNLLSRQMCRLNNVQSSKV